MRGAVTLVGLWLVCAPAWAQDRTPNEAYAAGEFEEALEGFLDLQVERPDDAAVQMNVGSTQFRLGDFDSAALSFATVAATGDASVKSEAFYNLGNTSYRRGQLEEAIQYYESSLDHDPEDSDAKFNLEFVRDEMRRRQEEAEKRREEQEKQEQDAEQDPSDSQPGEDESEQQGEGAPPQTGPDRDQDGLPDAIEEQGSNPTDPDQPDSDGDGLMDGEEDANLNGNLDPGETDPNNPDSDGDGTPDAEEMRPSDAQGQPPPEEGLSEAEAARFLDALEEGQPRRKVPAAKRRVEKDW